MIEKVGDKFANFPKRGKERGRKARFRKGQGGTPPYCFGKSVQSFEEIGLRGEFADVVCVKSAQRIENKE
jgi:hypothetical protein